MARSISTQMLTLGGLCAVALCAMIIVIQILLEIRLFQSALEDDLERTFNAYSAHTMNALSELDDEAKAKAVNEVIDGLMQSEYLTRVQLIDADGNILGEHVDQHNETFGLPLLSLLLGEPLSDYEITLRSPDSNALLGLLKVSFNQHLRFQEMHVHLWLQLLLNIAEIVLLAMLLIFLFNNILIKPLLNLHKQLATIDINNAGEERISELKGHRDDELGILVNTLNSQIQTVGDLIGANRVALTDAERSYESITTLIDSLPLLISLRDKDKQPLLANRAFLTTFDLSEEQFLKVTTEDPLLTLLPESQRQQFEEADNAALNHSGSIQLPDTELTLIAGRTISLESHKLAINYKGHRAVLTVSFDMTERRENQEHIRHLAYHDSLTNLPNRHLCIETLERALLQSQITKKSGAVIFVDLDNFNAINDSHGHAIGDAILVEVATRLSEGLSAQDSVARLGGDEFVACFTCLPTSTAAARDIGIQKTKALLDRLQQPFFISGHTFNLTASLGLAFFKDHELTASELLQNADMAMNSAKARGKNQFNFFEPEMMKSRQPMLRLKEDCKIALEEGQFFLMYQPQVNNKYKSIIGAEALLRWSHPTRGTVSPAEFIPLLEQLELMPQVGEFITSLAIGQVAKWYTAGKINKDFKICINVSPQQFRRHDFTEVVSRIITDSALPSGMVTLEITESMIIDNIDHTVALINKLRRLGIHFSIDDFGTGYSNLNYLKRLPLDVLKVDQSFVRDIQNDPNDAAIVRTILAMADQLKLKTVAEGVETEEQLAALDAMGCYVFQGYLYAPPLSPDEFETLLLRDSA